MLACRSTQPLALDASTVAVVASQPVVLTGQSLGDSGSALLNGVAIPVVWTPTSIAVTLPEDARSGVLTLEGENEPRRCSSRCGTTASHPGHQRIAAGDHP